ncbi:hypothetical protein L0337_19000, partial [candidate division KSB1 bacterium]|nr:hypothetical protein [candidate division KSB1 bacterium]
MGVIVALLLGLATAAALGIYIAEGNLKMVGAVFGIGFFLAVLLGLEKKYWIIVPAAFAFHGLPAVPFVGGRQFTFEEILIPIATVIFVIGLALHRQKLRLFSFYNFFIFAYFAWGMMIFFLNPIGLAALGSSVGGAR